MTMEGQHQDKNKRAERNDPLVQLHLFMGWGALLVFAMLGLFLEGLHAFKAPWYLDADQETRRLLWRLGHAHGALLSILHLAFAFTVSSLSAFRRTTLCRVVSRLFIAALVLLPAGFLLGGAASTGGDPGTFILLVPVGALALLLAIFFTARASAKSR